MRLQTTYDKLCESVMWAVVIVGCGSFAAYGAEISVRNTVVPNGSTRSASMLYKADGAAVSGLQFDIEYDHNVVLALTVTAGEAANSAGKSVVTAQLPNGDLRVVIIGFNQTTIADGVIAVLNVSLSSYAAPGPYHLRLTNVIGVTPSADPILVQARDGQIVGVPANTSPQ